MKGIKTTLCFGIALAVISFSFVSAETAGLAGAETAKLVSAETVKLDIKPGRCPNPLNINSFGLLPVVILGTEDFDVNDVDPATVLLEGIAPAGWHLEDVSTPVEAGGDPCECRTGSADGFLDLHLRFPVEELVETLEAGGPLEDGEVIVLTLTGMTYDGASVEGSDCIFVVDKGRLKLR
jgi:hypothetical protein